MKRFFEHVFVLIFWLLVWACIAAAVGSELLVPFPTAVFLKIIELCRKSSCEDGKQTWRHKGKSVDPFK